MRWRWPPENSCGYNVAARSGRPTKSSSSATRRRRPGASRSALITSGSATIVATRMRGSSDAYGSWKTAWTERRYARSPSRPSVATSRPSKRMLPAVGFSSPRMSLDVVVLPQPDSPTRPSVAPAGIANETESTARTTPEDQPSAPLRTTKCLVRSMTSRRWGAMSGPPMFSPTMEPAARRVAGRDVRLGWRLDAAVERGRAARGERAARAEGREVGRLPGDRGETRASHPEARDRLEQGARVGMGGRGEDPAHRSGLDDTAGVHDGHAIAGPRHDPEVVGDEDHRHPAAADLLHLGLALSHQIVAVEEHLAADDARGRPRDEAHDAQARHALARAGLADEAERLALPEREGHAIHRLDRSPAGDDV